MASHDRGKVSHKLDHLSPDRHHKRSPSQHREVIESLNAKSEYKDSSHSVNQYVIMQEVGRGSFGAVHLAVDQYGHEFAVKEFSKARLRKRAQSNILRRPRAVKRTSSLAAGGVEFNSPLHRHSASDMEDAEGKGNPLFLIKEEIAIMKKLNHPNLVELIEVLDDPEEDSLYMVLEMCKKGVVMKVGLDEKSDPYDEESCRCWFRDLILGIEYLHAQGVVHRDIKPDNLLLTEDDVLKIVDFGVSEMFEKASDMKTAKSTGSPAFLPPELCVAKHGDVSGKAADIWSMGISLYCLRFGRIPFERSGVLELYEAIKNDTIDYTPDNEPRFVDLMNKILEKDPEKRIKMHELREHPWVTKAGTDPMMSEEENTGNLVEPPTQTEMNHAITSNMTNLLAVVKAVKKFQGLLGKKRSVSMSGTVGNGLQKAGFDGKDGPPLSRSEGDGIKQQPAINRPVVPQGVRVDTNLPDSSDSSVNRMDSAVTITPALYRAQHQLQSKGQQIDENAPPPATLLGHPQEGESVGEKGHAHDPLDEEPLWLGIGIGGVESGLVPPEVDAVVESPTAAEFNIYDTAYQEEVDRIRQAQGEAAKVYLTRRVDAKKKYKADANMIDLPAAAAVAGKPHEGWKGLVDAARAKEEVPKTGMDESEGKISSPGGRGKLRGLASYAKAAGSNALARGQGLFTKNREAAAEKDVEKREQPKGKDGAGVQSQEGGVTKEGAAAVVSVVRKAMEARGDKVEATESES